MLKNGKIERDFIVIIQRMLNISKEIQKKRHCFPLFTYYSMMVPLDSMVVVPIWCHLVAVETLLLPLCVFAVMIHFHLFSTIWKHKINHIYSMNRNHNGTLECWKLLKKEKKKKKLLLLNHNALCTAYIACGI